MRREQVTSVAKGSVLEVEVVVAKLKLVVDVIGDLRVGGDIPQPTNKVKVKATVVSFFKNWFIGGLLFLI
jgi:hypothetical protein